MSSIPPRLVSAFPSEFFSAGKVAVPQPVNAGLSALVHISVVTISAVLLALPAHGMDIRTCDNQVILSGRVEGDEYSRVEDILSQNPRIRTAVLRNSPGGDADTGYRVGELFREKGIATY